MTRCRDCDDAV